MHLCNFSFWAASTIILLAALLKTVMHCMIEHKLLQDVLQLVYIMANDDAILGRIHAHH